MSTETVRARVRKGVLWSSGSQGAIFILQILQALIVARALGPELYAEVAVIHVVLGLSIPFAQSGLGVSIVYYEEDDPRRLAQLQTLAVAMATAVAAIVVALAGPVAAYFQIPDARFLIQLAAATIWLSAVSSVWQSQLKRHLLFREVEIAYLANGGATFAVVLAVLWAGGGALSVVIGQIAGVALNSAMLVFALASRGLAPGFAVPDAALIPHLKYGGVNTLSALASSLSTRIDAMVVGGVLSPAAFGAYGFFSRIIGSLLTPIQRIRTSIEFPTYTRLMNDRERLRRTFAKVVGVTVSATAPLFVGVALVADLALELALGPQWTQYGLVFAALSIYGLVRVISASSTSLFMAAGLVTRSLILVAVRLIVFPLAIFAAIAVSPTLISVAVAVTGVQLLSIVGNYVAFVRPVLGPSAGLLAALVARPLAACAIMAGCVWSVRAALADAPAALEFTSAAGAGALAYVAATAMLNRETLREAGRIVRPLVNGLPAARPLLRFLD